MQRMNPILSDRIHNNNQENSILIEDCMYNDNIWEEQFFSSLILKSYQNRQKCSKNVIKIMERTILLSYKYDD